MLTIIGAYCQPVVQACGGDEQIKVADEGALLPAPSRLPPEQLIPLLSNWDNAFELIHHCH
jgi:hypothetical protein